VPADMNDIDDWPARNAYESGTDPVAYAEKRVAVLIQVHLLVAEGRAENPASFAVYSRDLSDGALARRILGGLLAIGWTPPDIDPPMPLAEGVPAGIDDLDEGPCGE
jgi:hypothetical protein